MCGQCLMRSVAKSARLTIVELMKFADKIWAYDRGPCLRRRSFMYLLIFICYWFARAPPHAFAIYCTCCQCMFGKEKMRGYKRRTTCVYSLYLFHCTSIDSENITFRIFEKKKLIMHCHRPTNNSNECELFFPGPPMDAAWTHRAINKM